MRTRGFLAAMTLAALAAGCGGAKTGGETSNLRGNVAVDGSSTVFPISEAVAEEFQKENPNVKVTVGQSGTGGGFKKFCNGETDVSDASRPIKPEEAATCRAKGVEHVELKVATDGLSVLVNPRNDFVKCLTVDQLKKIWEPGSTVKTWKDVDAKWPAEAIKLYGPGADSGTFDYFTEEIVGEAKKSRSDYTQSEDDNVLVQGISEDRNALGYFGFAYYEENASKLKLVGVDSGSGCVTPSEKTINEGTYTPLSRPLFIYAKKAALGRPELKAFVEYYVANVNDLLDSVGYIPLHDDEFAKTEQALEQAIGGS